jgi:hypothetical protein
MHETRQNTSISLLHMLPVRVSNDSSYTYTSANCRVVVDLRDISSGYMDPRRYPTSLFPDSISTGYIRGANVSTGSFIAAAAVTSTTGASKDLGPHRSVLGV